MFSIVDVWDSAKEQHRDYVRGQIRKHLKYPRGHADRVTCIALRRFAIQYSEQIACGSVDEVKSLIAKVEQLFSAQGAGPYMALFMMEATKIFNYKYFITVRKAPWCAYELCKTSHYRICPYCAQNFAFTLTSEGPGNKQFRPTLDHFFHKSKYPYLAISLYNLVPSCYTCNSNLKGETDFHTIPHLHPFALDKYIRFELTSKNQIEITRLAANRWCFEKFATLHIRPEKYSPAAQNSIKTFLLANRFHLYEKEFIRFAYLRRQLTQRRMSQVRRIFDGSVDEFTLLGFDARNFKNQIHGRVFADLYRQFKPNSQT